MAESTAQSLFPGFRHFRSRLLFYLLVLLVPVLGVIFYYVNRNNAEYTEETINRYLELGADVFDYTRNQQALTLQAITNSLTWDFGFRTAYGSRDPATLFDAALNVLDRSLDNVDMLMIAGLDLEVVIDTEIQGFETLEGPWRQLVEQADADEYGQAEMILTLDGDPYQLIALPLYLPRQVAWIVGGFALDGSFVELVSESVLSEVSIVRSNTGSDVEVIQSTLDPARQSALEQQLQLSAGNLTSLQRIDFGDEEFTTLFRPLYGQPGEANSVHAVFQRSYDENNENVVQFRQLLIQFYAAVFVFSLLGVIWLARSITNPVARLAGVVKRIDDGDYQQTARIESRDELGQLAESVNSMAKGLAEKEKVRDLLGKVVSHQIAEELLNNPVELGGEEREVTILFSDIRGFTSYCEGKSPKDVLDALNRVLTAISDIIERHNGVVDKYQGDAVMALFGAPVKGDRDAENAMAAALEIIDALSKLDSQLSACVGINSGQVVAGNLGSQNRLNYSVIGDTVNLAARLESLTRLYNVSNIVSESGTLAAPGFVYQELDEVRVAGKQESVRIFQLLGREGDIGSDDSATLTAYAAALKAYRQADWDSAEEQFSALAQKCDNAPLCQEFLRRIQAFREHPPAADWGGVMTFGKK